MSKEKISISEMVDLMAAKSKFTKKHTEEFVKMLLSTVEDVLIEGETVKIKDFGVFKPQWNEARKSVDVNTGEEIILPGYYKAVFIPENDLKELANKPYADLEPILLGTNEEKTNPETEENLPIAPIRMMEEQAAEIRGILSEIQSLSVKKEDEKDSHENEEIKEEKEVEKIEKNDVEEEAIGKEFETETANNENKNVENEDEDEEMPALEEENEKSALENKFPDYESKKERKRRLKREAEEEKQRIKEEIRAYFLANPWNEVREVKLKLVERMPAQETHVNNEEKITENQETNQSFPESFSEIVASEKETEIEPETYHLSPVSTEETAQEVMSEKEAELEENSIDYSISAPGESEHREEAPLYNDEVNIVTPENGEPIPAAQSVTEVQKEVQKSEIQKSKTELPVTDHFELHGKKRRPVLIWILIALFLISALVLLLFYPFNKSAEIQQKALLPTTDTVEAVVPIDTVNDSINSFPVANDTILVDVFKSPRNYTEFQGEETIVKGIGLGKLAQKYYGNWYFWVYIYEANKEKIVNPNDVPAGTVLKIPKLPEELINVKNPKAIRFAESLSYQYLKIN